MMTTNCRRLVAAATVFVIAAALPAAAFAQKQVADIVKERIERMKGLWPNIDPSNKIAKGESTNFDVAIEGAVKLEAELKALAGLFPPGSGRDVVPDTRAKPEVWTNRAEFEAALRKLVAESAKLTVATKTRSIESIRGQMPSLAEACGGCHEGPRRKGGKFRFEQPE